MLALIHFPLRSLKGEACLRELLAAKNWNLKPAQRARVHSAERPQVLAKAVQRRLAIPPVFVKAWAGKLRTYRGFLKLGVPFWGFL